MPAKSQAQQKIFGIARAIQKGEMKPGAASGAARKIAKDVKPGDVKKFAKTKHAGLPTRKDESRLSSAQIVEVLLQ